MLLLLESLVNSLSRTICEVTRRYYFSKLSGGNAQPLRALLPFLLAAFFAAPFAAPFALPDLVAGFPATGRFFDELRFAGLAFFAGDFAALAAPVCFFAAPFFVAVTFVPLFFALRAAPAFLPPLG